MIKNSFSAVGIFGSKALLPVKEGLTTDRPGIKGPGKESELGRLLKYYSSKVGTHSPPSYGLQPFSQTKGANVMRGG